MMYDRPDSNQAQILFDKTITLEDRQTLTLSYHDASLGSDRAAGRKLYFETSLGTNAGCRICHSLDEGATLVGPSFAGIATRAAERVPGMSAEEYLRQSILEPDAYVVEGFPSGQMVPNLGEILTEQQIDDLIAFLMTFDEE
jgi:cytochrome c2